MTLMAYLVSPFDEKLAEDRRVNRLEDSYLLWRSVVSCKLLARTQIILCKWRLWYRKLCFDWRGRNKFWTSVIFYKRSFKEESEYEIQFPVSETARMIFLPLRDVSVYLDSDRRVTNILGIDFQQHFKEISKQHSPVPRPFYMYLTSVIVSCSPFYLDGNSILPNHQLVLTNWWSLPPTGYTINSCYTRCR